MHNTNILYQIRTIYGITHKYIKGWKTWSEDESFIEFNQKGESLIIPKNQILTIYAN